MLAERRRTCSIYRAVEDGRRRSRSTLPGPSGVAVARWLGQGLPVLGLGPEPGGAGLPSLPAAMSLDPGIVVTHDVLMMEARQQCHLALDPAEVPAGRVDGDALHRIAAAVQLVLHLPLRKGEGKRVQQVSHSEPHMDWHLAAPAPSQGEPLSQNPQL